MSQLIKTPQPHLIVDEYCRQCGCLMSGQDNFCSKCGHSATRLLEEQNATEESRNAVSQLQPTFASNPIETVLNQRILVVAVIAFLGPLGLPALWFSPRFSRATKIVSTSIYLFVTTILPILVIWYFLDYSLRPLVEVFGK